MTVEYKGFQIGDQVRFTEGTVKPGRHKDATKGIVVNFDEGDGFEFLVRADDNSCEWYREAEIELLGTVVKQQATVKLDEQTVRTIAVAVEEIFNVKESCDREITATIAGYFRGLTDGMGIDRDVQ